MKFAREGYPFILGSLFPALALIGLFAIVNWLALLIAGLFLLLLALACAFFFRNPNRVIPRDEKILISPADGWILQIKEVDDDFVGRGYRVDIFLTVLDVHINRVPASGKIEFVKYRSGKFISAFKDKASSDNERTDIGINGRQGKFRVAQIAGSIARRIVCHVKENDEVLAGQIYGMIRFGSRTEITFPAIYSPAVQSGQHVKGGETIVGRLTENA